MTQFCKGGLFSESLAEFVLTGISLQRVKSQRTLVALARAGRVARHLRIEIAQTRERGRLRRAWRRGGRQPSRVREAPLRAPVAAQLPAQSVVSIMHRGTRVPAPHGPALCLSAFA